jgi:hypothetical protein
MYRLQRYENACSRREAMRYHIDWAKSRGDHDDARALAQQLVEIDKVHVRQIHRVVHADASPRLPIDYMHMYE